MKKRILVVEDEREIARLTELHLLDLGCEVTLAHDGESGLREAVSGKHDLMILDLMLPGLDGLEICRRVRSSASSHLPILMLTARSSEFDRVLGLEIGADDYLTKPFSVRELVARVKAIFRRLDALSQPGETEGGGEIHVRGLTIDVEKRRVELSGRGIHLTAKEFDLLLYFARHPGRVYTRAQLLDSVWGYGHDGYEHTVNSHINRLRSKIEDDPANPVFVQTVWGVGYRFNDEADADETAASGP